MMFIHMVLMEEIYGLVIGIFSFKKINNNLIKLNPKFKFKREEVNALILMSSAALKKEMS